MEDNPGQQILSGGRHLLAVLSQVWEPQKEVNLRSLHFSAVHPRSPPPSLAGFLWGPTFLDAGRGALALKKDIAMEVGSKKQVCNAQACLTKSGFILNSHPFQAQSTLRSMSMRIALCLLNSVAVYSSAQNFYSHFLVILFSSKLQ